MLQDVLKTLYHSSPQSITEISSTTGKSIPLVTKIVQELLEEKLIVAEGLAASTGGRRAAQFSLNSTSLPLVLVIAIDQYTTTLSLLNLANEPQKELAQRHIRLNETETALDNILELVNEYLANQSRDNILTIALSMPGFVDSEKGINSSYSSTHRLHHIRQRIEEHIHIPTYVENDSTAIALSEHLFGKAKGCKNALVINLNWGVGLGMILDGKQFKGHSGYAGEFSHIPLSDQNKLCSCGKRGCLEVEASLKAALEYASEKIDNGQISQLTINYGQAGPLTIDRLIGAALHGDQLAIESFAKIGYMLGKGIATLIHIINPEKIIISGRGAEVGTIIMPQIQSAILEFAIKRLSEETQIECSTLQNAQIMGTAAVAVCASSWKIRNTVNKK